MNKYLKYFLYVIGYMGVWAIFMYPVLIYLQQKYGPQSREMLYGFLFFLITIFSSWIPFMIWAAARVFVYPGEGNPVSEEELRKQILEINSFDAPVRVKEKGKKLSISWNYVDAKWFGIISKSHLSKHYELLIRFNNKTKTATLIDIQKEISFGLNPGEFKLRGGFFRGISFTYEKGIAWGITDNFKIGKVYDYKFTNAEIKTPVMNTIIRNGWTVKMGIF